jgi:hypothetical protein
MTKSGFEKLLTSLFPTFGKYWSREDIHRESDGSFTAHGPQAIKKAGHWSLISARNVKNFILAGYKAGSASPLSPFVSKGERVWKY